jgi:hypothetical protein
MQTGIPSISHQPELALLKKMATCTFTHNTLRTENTKSDQNTSNREFVKR